MGLIDHDKNMIKTHDNEIFARMHENGYFKRFLTWVMILYHFR